MKKRVITLVTALLMLVCLVCLPSMATEAEPVYQAGFAQVDITPAESLWENLPLSVYGDSERTILGVETLTDSEGAEIASNLAVSCIAITDSEDTTVLFITIDAGSSNQYWSNEAKTAIVEALAALETPVEMTEDRIYISATGTLGAPELVYSGTDAAEEEAVLAYEEFVIAQTAEAAKQAVADRSEVKMYYNLLDTSDAVSNIAAANSTTVSTNEDRLNYSAVYDITDADGNQIGTAGASFGPSSLINNSKDTYTATEIFTPDDTMGLLLLDPVDESKTSIVMANWSAKMNLSTNGTYRYGMDHRNYLTADYAGFFRNALNEAGYRTAIFQGASGNVNAYSLDSSAQDPSVVATYTYTENDTTKTTKYVSPLLYGEKLASIALYGITATDENVLQAADPAVPIVNTKFRFATEPNVPSDDQVTLVNNLRDAVTNPVPETYVDADGAVYATLYDYAVADDANFATLKTAYEAVAGFTALADLKDNLQLTGIYSRMQHSVRYVENEETGEKEASSTSFATDAVACDASVIQLGAMTFVTAPVDLYDNYGKYDDNGNLVDTWDDVGAQFAFGNTNGASGHLPDSGAYDYNEGSDTYYQGSNYAWSVMFPDGAGERLMETYCNILKSKAATTDNTENQIRRQCECGTAESEFESVTLPGHTHELKDFYPWYDADSIPIDGNYYLMTDVVQYQEVRTGSGKISIDLNGHTITRKVLPEVILDPAGTEVPDDHYYRQTRLFAVQLAARITVTDTSGEGTGKLLRDVSSLTAISATEQEKITNYGLLIAVISTNTSDNVLYKATLDATGQVSGGGACVALMSADASFTMYDGSLIGGISSNGTAVYAGAGELNLRGGSITGGTALNHAAEGETPEYRGNVFVGSSVKLLLAGNTTVSGGLTENGDASNLSLPVGAQTLTVDPEYTGTAAITFRTTEPLNGRTVGVKGDVTDAVVEGQLSVENAGYEDYKITTCEISDTRKILMVADIREYCVCGGKGTEAHTCENISWKPWPYSYYGYLSGAAYGGNYYLMDDIAVKVQKNVRAELNLDLNGNNITHQVDPTVEDWASYTRVFNIGDGGSLSITDSTDTPGTVTRDLSLLSEEQKAGISNYGLIVILNEEATGDFMLWNGTLDATGQVSGGGACVANLTGDRCFYMYGGTLNGGISSTAGAIWSSGPVEIHGGTVTGGKATGSGIGGIRIVSWKNSKDVQCVGSLKISSNAVITGNVDANGNPSNIKSFPGADSFTVVGEYTGTAGVLFGQKPYHLMKVAVSDNADISGAVFTSDDYADTPGYEFRIVDGYIVTYLDAAYITYEDETPVSYHKTLQDALDRYPGGKATVTLYRDVAEDNLTIGQTTYLDLKGYDVTNTGFTAGEYQLYVFDSETDDYTVENDDGNGYGLLNGDIATSALGLPLDTDIVTAVKPTDHYLKITEADGTSFHRLNLRFAGLTLRPDSLQDDTYWPGLYYNSQFGGDEVIQRNITTYGVGMSAISGEEMFTRDNSYTAIAAENWITGADADGNSNNLANGTILTGILKTTNINAINRRNGNRQIRGQNYVILTDGSRVVGPEVSYSLKDWFVAYDARWENAGATTKSDILKLYDTYGSSVMQYWNIPNIKAAYAEQ